MTRKEMLSYSVTVVAVSALVFIVYIGLSYLSLGGDLEHARKQILAAYEAGDLGEANYAPGNTIIGSHQFNDCLILEMAIEQREPDRLKLAISPAIPDPAKAELPCVALHELAKGELPPGTQEFYHHYLHGHTVLARYLLPVLGVHNLRLFWSSLLSLTTMGIVALAMYRLARGGDLWTHVLFLAIGMSLARWFGLETYGQSLGHAPPDFVAAAFALYLCAVANRGCTRGEIVLAATLFGCFTIVTEFLSGGLPLGLAMIFGIVPFVIKRDASEKDLLVSTAVAGAAFAVAASLCVVFKLALVLAVFGTDPVTEFIHALGVRMALAEADWAPRGGVLVWARSIIGSLKFLTAEMRVLAGVGLMLALVGGLWGLHRILTSCDDVVSRVKASALAASNLVLLAWFLVFWQHTLQHSFFMARIIVWTIASGNALFAMGVIVARSSPLVKLR